MAINCNRQTDLVASDQSSILSSSLKNAQSPSQLMNIFGNAVSFPEATVPGCVMAKKDKE